MLCGMQKLLWTGEEPWTCACRPVQRTPSVGIVRPGELPFPTLGPTVLHRAFTCLINTKVSHCLHFEVGLITIMQ